MKMSLLSVIHDLHRSEETDREEESLRFGWILEVYEEIGRGKRIRGVGGAELWAQQEAMSPGEGVSDHGTPQGQDRQTDRATQG